MVSPGVHLADAEARGELHRLAVGIELQSGETQPQPLGDLNGVLLVHPLEQHREFLAAQAAEEQLLGHHLAGDHAQHAVADVMADSRR